MASRTFKNGWQNTKTSNEEKGFVNLKCFVNLLTSYITNFVYTMFYVCLLLYTSKNYYKLCSYHFDV